MSAQLDAALKKRGAAANSSSGAVDSEAPVLPDLDASEVIFDDHESHSQTDSSVVSDLSIGSFSPADVSDETDDEDDLAAELGEGFSSELPLSPNTLQGSLDRSASGSSSVSSTMSAAEMHAALLAEQRARVASGLPPESVFQPTLPHHASTSSTDIGGAAVTPTASGPRFHPAPSNDDDVESEVNPFDFPAVEAEDDPSHSEDDGESSVAH